MSLAIVTDDEEALRELHTMILQMAGYTDVRAFKKPEDALAEIKAEGLKPDFIATDYDMKKFAGSDITGIEYMQELRKDHPTVPMMLVSGGTGASKDADFVSETEKLNAAFLAKPASIPKFLAAVEQAKEIAKGETVPPPSAEAASAQAAMPVVVYAGRDLLHSLLIELTKKNKVRTEFKLSLHDDADEAVKEVEDLKAKGVPVVLVSSLTSGITLPTFAKTHPEIPVVVMTGSMDPDPSEMPPDAALLKMPKDLDDLNVVLDTAVETAKKRNETGAGKGGAVSAGGGGDPSDGPKLGHKKPIIQAHHLNPDKGAGRYT